jgi:hypothetical protein
MKRLTGIFVGVMLCATPSSGQDRIPQVAGSYIGGYVVISDGVPAQDTARMRVEQDRAEIKINGSFTSRDEDGQESPIDFSVGGTVDANGFVSMIPGLVVASSEEECGLSTIPFATLAFRGSRALLSAAYMTESCGWIVLAALLER